LKQSEIQYETDEQKRIIINVLNDMLSLSSEELKNKKYPNYSNQIDTWDLPTVIERYFVPNNDTLLFEEDFYSNIKTNEVQEIIKDLIVHLKTDNKKEEVENLGTFGDLKSQLDTLLNSGGITEIVNWTEKHLKINSKVKFIHNDKDGPKNDVIIIISHIIIEKLDETGNETGDFYLGNNSNIDTEKSDLFFSFRENFKDEKYNLVIYKKKEN